MLYNINFTENILGLKDVLIGNLYLDGNNLIIPIEMPRTTHVCPSCGESTNSVHDYRYQNVRDLDAFGRGVVLLFKKRRYCCPHCNKRFYESVHFLPKYYRRTQRVIFSIINELGYNIPTKYIANTYRVSSPTVIRYLKLINYKCTQLPEVLSVDEFRGNANKEKFQSIITDPSNSKVLDILPTRTEKDLIEYFKSFSTRYSVKYYVTDMSNHFRRVGKACFPNAIHIADRFHVIRQVCWALENVRKTEQLKYSDKWRKYFKRSRFLFTKKYEKLNDEEKEKLSIMLSISPRLASAYRLKNKFMEVMRCKNLQEAKKKFSDWFILAEYEAIPEFENCINAYHNWSKEIINAIEYPYSNGFTEGCNNRIKVLKRNGYGYRNFENFRLRILHISRNQEQIKKTIKKRYA